MKSILKTVGGLLVLVALLAGPSPVRADTTRYVSDQLIITLRADKGPNAKILTTLKTGTPVEVLEKGDRYLKVRTQGGVEGYVQKQYLVAATPKSVIIAGLKKERDQLAAQLSELKKSQAEMSQQLESAKQNLTGKVQQAQGQSAQMQTALAESQKKLQEMTAQYSALKQNSQHVVTLVQERDRLKSENAKLSAEAKKLRQEEGHLLYAGMIQWFLAGAGVFFLGWLIGKMSRKKRRGF
jgi:SH3 domain protein